MIFLKRTLPFLMALLMIVGCLASCTTDPVEEETTTEETTSASSADSTTEPTSESESESETEAETEKYDFITIEKALELCGEEGNITTDRYYIKGEIVSVTNSIYGEMIIKDETGSISVYGTYSADGSLKYSELEDKPYKGDIVILHCILQNHEGTKEIKNARLIEFEHVEVEIDESQYTDMSVADAREAAVGTKIKVDGVVAQITYANGKIPTGVFLVDGTQSIYVYGKDIAGRVKVGNTVTVLGSKAYWINEKETSSAAKFEYKGCCQLEDVTVVSVDENVVDFDKSWIKESTVKEILDTPVTENITATIYKVNALVKKAPGSGFTNYYFYDIDGKTGSYTYTQCNGSDFEWLDEFDGKICTVYLSPINAKASGTECFFRFSPIKVVDEGYTFDTAKAAEYAVKYHGVTQFNSRYTGNPEIEVITSVSSELLGIENVRLTYKSDNETSVFFTEADGKVVFNCGEGGVANVTVEAEYDGKKYSETVKIQVASNATYDTITVVDAQNTAVGETVLIKGIVGPSVVNKNGFYLFDETGMIAVVVNDASIFGEIEIGHEIVIEGKRDCYKDAGKTHAGQICITSATVLANYYGNHDYPTDKFITDKDLKYIYDLDVNEDHSTEVYVVKATITFVESDHYTKLEVTDNGTKLTLYCSGAGQYSFLKQFNGQEVILEIAPCNWNNKTYYAGCALAVRTEDGKVLNELNFIK